MSTANKTPDAVGTRVQVTQASTTHTTPTPVVATATTTSEAGQNSILLLSNSVSNSAPSSILTSTTTTNTATKTKSQDDVSLLFSDDDGVNDDAHEVADLSTEKQRENYRGVSGVQFTIPSFSFAGFFKVIANIFKDMGREISSIFVTDLTSVSSSKPNNKSQFYGSYSANVLLPTPSSKPSSNSVLSSPLMIADDDEYDSDGGSFLDTTSSKLSSSTNPGNPIWSQRAKFNSSASTYRSSEPMYTTTELADDDEGANRLAEECEKAPHDLINNPRKFAQVFDELKQIVKNNEKKESEAFKMLRDEFTPSAFASYRTNEFKHILSKTRRSQKIENLRPEDKLLICKAYSRFYKIDKKLNENKQETEQKIAEDKRIVAHDEAKNTEKHNRSHFKQFIAELDSMQKNGNIREYHLARMCHVLQHAYNEAKKFDTTEFAEGNINSYEETLTKMRTQMTSGSNDDDVVRLEEIIEDKIPLRELSPDDNRILVRAYKHFMNEKVNTVQKGVVRNDDIGEVHKMQKLHLDHACRELCDASEAKGKDNSFKAYDKMRKQWEPKKEFHTLAKLLEGLKQGKPLSKPEERLLVVKAFGIYDKILAKLNQKADDATSGMPSRVQPKKQRENVENSRMVDDDVEENYFPSSSLQYNTQPPVSSYGAYHSYSDREHYNDSHGHDGGYGESLNNRRSERATNPLYGRQTHSSSSERTGSTNNGTKPKNRTNAPPSTPVKFRRTDIHKSNDE